MARAVAIRNQPDLVKGMMQHRRKMLMGSVANLTKVLLTAPFSLILPPLFVHRMSPADYGAWMLILQSNVYINLLDLGLQTAVSKYVAQYDAAGDKTAGSRILSSSFAILCASALIGTLIIAIATLRVPQLFDQMPAYLIANTREGLLLVGVSTAFLLPFNVFLSAFVGLQRYRFPTIVAVVSKSALSIALIVSLLFHGDLLQLAWLTAAFNFGTASIQYVGWRKYLNTRVDFAFRFIHRDSAVRLAKYGSTLSIWTVAMLFVSGLDMLIVGHYDYTSTAYYGTATAAANFMLLIIVSAFAPLLPAVASLQSGTSSGKIGTMVVTATRLCALLLCIITSLVAFGAYPLLTLWVGQAYAIRSASFLEVLVVGSAIRQLCYPYALVVVATGKQHHAVTAAVAEALTNISVSIFLVQRIGALGVAIGTVVGALVSVGIHITVSMSRTQSVVSLSRRNFVLEGLIRPLTCTIPTLLFLPFWVRSALIRVSPVWMGPWCLATIGIAWFVGLTPAERQSITLKLLRFVR